MLRICHSGAIEGDDISTGCKNNSSGNNNNNYNNTENNKIKINRGICDNCFKCADICPSKALVSFGKLMSIEDVLNVVEKDNVFYSRSRGGLTLCGGEPLMQSEFAVGLLKEAKEGE